MKKSIRPPIAIAEMASPLPFSWESFICRSATIPKIKPVIIRATARIEMIREDRKEVKSIPMMDRAREDVASLFLITEF